MQNPISLFIMDVSNSSLEDNGEELSIYLDELVSWMTSWTEEFGPIKVKHRSGDEIIFIGGGYSTAYIIAFYISQIWKYTDHKPYFGLSFGDIDKNLAEVDVEKWIHPLIKQARYANDLLKQEQIRSPFKFELDQFYPSENSSQLSYHQFRFEFETLMNTIIKLQQNLIKEQTDIQKAVCSLYLIFQQQKVVGKLLGKTPPTISSHYKKGKTEDILDTFNEMITMLNSLQEKSYFGKDTIPNENSKKLIDSIRNHLKEKMRTEQ
ncbi:hypothetical protein [Neobacillus sp. FSL H8-0543]|uniref:hypothetical protein n=1 Tax=Neobacillus sp. FSL H8-0543 TaxID=2954672 RepID=UPI003158FC77